jgi:hypothetical protein
MRRRPGKTIPSALTTAPAPTAATPSTPRTPDQWREAARTAPAALERALADENAAREQASKVEAEVRAPVIAKRADLARRSGVPVYVDKHTADLRWQATQQRVFDVDAPRPYSAALEQLTTGRSGGWGTRRR